MLAANQNENKQITNYPYYDYTRNQGDWNITKGKLKQKWAKLTDDDLQYAEGKQEDWLADSEAHR